VAKKVNKYLPTFRVALWTSLLGHLFLLAFAGSGESKAIKRNGADDLFIADFPGFSVGRNFTKPKKKSPIELSQKTMPVPGTAAQVFHSKQAHDLNSIRQPNLSPNPPDRGAGTASEVGRGSRAGDFRNQLRAALEEQKEYPAIAKSRGQTGTVKVGFTLRKQGVIDSVHLVELCAYERLNLAALETVKRLGRFKPVPDEVSKGDWTVVVPMEFTLTD
jgi:TonB family protein